MWAKDHDDQSNDDMEVVKDAYISRMFFQITKSFSVHVYTYVAKFRNTPSSSFGCLPLTACGWNDKAPRSTIWENRKPSEFHL